MYKLEDYRCVFPVLAPLKFVKKADNDYRIVIDYSTSINKYDEGKEQLYTDEKFFDEIECIEYLDSEIYMQDEENGSCQRFLQKIGDVYYYMHNIFAKIYLDCFGYNDSYAFLDFGEKGGKGNNILVEETFSDERELLEYLRKEVKRWDSTVFVKKEEKKELELPNPDFDGDED